MQTEDALRLGAFGAKRAPPRARARVPTVGAAPLARIIRQQPEKLEAAVAPTVLNGGAKDATVRAGGYSRGWLRRGTLPRGSRRSRSSCGEQGEALPVRIARGQREPDPGRQLGDP